MCERCWAQGLAHGPCYHPLTSSSDKGNVHLGQGGPQALQRLKILELWCSLASPGSNVRFISTGRSMKTSFWTSSSGSNWPRTPLLINQICTTAEANAWQRRHPVSPVELCSALPHVRDCKVWKWRIQIFPSLKSYSLRAQPSWSYFFFFFLFWESLWTLNNSTGESRGLSDKVS